MAGFVLDPPERRALGRAGVCSRAMSLRTGSFLLGVAALAACGTGDDAMMGDDVIDPPDTTPPILMASTPADAATKVVPLAALTFTFDEELAPSSVNESSVIVTYPNLSYVAQIKGTVAYDVASRTITFTPRLPLATGMKHTVHLANTITDEAGNAFTGGDLTFITSVNSQAKKVAYNTTTNQPSSWTQYTLDANGRHSMQVGFSPGIDGIAMTSDDVANSHIEFLHNPSGQLLEHRTYRQGPDGLWNTADDVIDVLQRLAYDSQGRQTESTSTDAAGPDGMWGTADDRISNHFTYTVTGGGVRYTPFSGPGNDGVWKTPDDRTSFYYEYTYNTQGAVQKFARTNAGPDQLAKTSDDVVTYYEEYTLDPSGIVLSTRYRNNAGPDAVWFTADDPTTRFEKYDVDANGFRVNYTISTNPGADAVFGTVDDVIAARNSFTNDQHGMQTSMTYYGGAGPDGMFGTADDSISFHSMSSYDANGQKTDQKRYTTPGPDNEWKNQDDRVSEDLDFDIAH